MARSQNDAMTGLLDQAWRNARKRISAEERAIDRAWVEAQAERQGWRCVMSGLPFSDETFETALIKRPYAPSIDRKDPSRGYDPDNCQLIATAVNFAKGQWTLGALVEVAHGIVETTRKNDDQRKALIKQLGHEEKQLKALESAEAKAARKRVAGIKESLDKGKAMTKVAAKLAADKKPAKAKAPEKTKAPEKAKTPEKAAAKPPAKPKARKKETA